MADTNTIIVDAIDNMAAHLETQRVAWGVNAIYTYPAYRVGQRGNAIMLECDGVTPQLVQVAAPQVQVDWKCSVRIWYFDASVEAERFFRDAYTTLSLVAFYLIENPRPNGYGELLLDDQAFGPVINGFPNEPDTGAPLIGASISAMLTVSKTHTQT